jgi:dGTPase
MDIEDAHKLRILTSEETIDLLLSFFEGDGLRRAGRVMDMVGDTNEKIAYLRSGIIGNLVDECSGVFLDNEEAIMSGDFRGPLIERICDPLKTAYMRCSKVAHSKIYCAKEVVDIELAGYHIFSRLIDILTEAVTNPSHSYSRLLLQRMPEQYDANAETLYGKVQCVLDYISGMTDVYALDLYRKVTGMSLN